MEIFGIEIKKKSPLPTPKDVGLIDMVEEFTRVCNNQVRGVYNAKAKEYNYETIEYYMGQAVEKAFHTGIAYGERISITNKLENDEEGSGNSI